MSTGNIFNDQTSERLATTLKSMEHRIVFAESCTAGLISASLGRIPGASEVLAGSAVVYQLDTKTAWLNVAPQTLIDPGPVSRTVSEQMARGALSNTPHASMAASVTGHLGPGAPEEQDGIAWSTVAIRNGTQVTMQSERLILDATPSDSKSVQADDLSRRHIRQAAAAELVMEFCLRVLQGKPGNG